MTPEQRLYVSVIASAVKDIAKNRREEDAIDYLLGPVFERHVMLAGWPNEAIGLLRESVLYSESARREAFLEIFKLMEGGAEKNAPETGGKSNLSLGAKD